MQLTVRDGVTLVRRKGEEPPRKRVSLARADVVAQARLSDRLRRARRRAHRLDGHPRRPFRDALELEHPGAGADALRHRLLGDTGVAGDYDGFRVFNRQTHQLYVSYRCRGPQNDVSLWRYNGRLLLFMSVDRPQIDGATVCGQDSSTDTVASDPRGWEGIRIFDITNPATPVYLKAVTTDCGSHTHTIVPDLANNRLLLYVSSFPIASQNIGGTCQQPFGKFSIVSVPLDAPETASVIAQPPVSAPPLERGRRLSRHHRVHGDPQGSRLLHERRPDLGHQRPGAPGHAASRSTSTTAPSISGTRPSSPGTGSTWSSTTRGTGRLPPPGNGRIWIYRRERRTPSRSSFMIPRQQGGAYCSVHNGNFIPVFGRYQLVAAWYGGGTGVIDLTNPTQPHEIAYYDATSAAPPTPGRRTGTTARSTRTTSRAVSMPSRSRARTPPARAGTT